MGGPNPFIVPARGGFIATAVNTESGATVIGLGRTATRFARPLKLEPRGVAIFAQPAPGTLPENVWAIGFSTTAGIPPRLVAIQREGEVVMDVARPEVAWREGRTVAITETPSGPVLHIDDRHLVLDTRGNIVIDLPRASADCPFAIEGGRLFAYDGASVTAVELATGKILGRIVIDGKPSAIRVDLWQKRLACRLERVLLTVDLGSLSERPPDVRAFVGGLFATPSAADANLGPTVGPPAGVECIDDSGSQLWRVIVPDATAVYAGGLLVGGEAVLTTNQPGGDRVLIARDGNVLFERPRAGAIMTSGALVRLGDRVAMIVAPGAAPGEPIEFGNTIDVMSIRGGGSVVYERPSSPGPGLRMIAVDAAGASVLEVTEGGGGARWAAASDGLVAVPRTNAARIDLYDTGAPA